MNVTLIHSVRRLVPGKGTFAGSVLLHEDRIARFDPPSSAVAKDAIRIDGRGRLLTPGLIDMHTHGIGTYLYEHSADDIIEAAAMLPRFGTTCVLPTLYRVMKRSSLKLLEQLANILPQTDERGTHMPGFHMEGPFLALPGAGAETLAGDVELLKDLWGACQGRIRAMSISPDTPAILPVIEWLAAHHVVPLITHTCATAEQTQAAICAGARHATHFYDVFPLLPETEPGVRPTGAVETILASKNTSVDFICDGVHVHPMAIRAALAAKTWRGVMAITDSNIGAGLPAGLHKTPWGFSVRTQPGDASRIADMEHPNRGSLAGSALTMDQAMRNILNWLRDDLPAERIWAMGTMNPARLLGLKRKGSIRLGADADLVLWDEQLRPAKTWITGRLVYEAS